jgi:hypothetical protein
MKTLTVLFWAAALTASISSGDAFNIPDGPSNSLVSIDIKLIFLILQSFI